MIVLDTHAWIWWVIGDVRLSEQASHAIGIADAIGIPAISCWEIPLLVKHHRLTLDREPLLWIQESLAAPRVQYLDLTPEIAAMSVDFEWGNRDPADRLILATAIIHDAPLISNDGKIRAFAADRVIWE